MNKMNILTKNYMRYLDVTVDTGKPVDAVEKYFQELYNTDNEVVQKRLGIYKEQQKELILMNYGLIYDLNENIDVDKVKQMKEKDRKKYFKKIEKKIKKENSNHESKMNTTFDFQLNQVKELVKMKDEFDVDEFKQIIYKEPSNIDVSKEAILFYSLFENTVRTGYDFVYSAKNYLSLVTDMLYFYRDNFNFRCDYVNKTDNQEIKIDVNNGLLQKYFNTLIERYVEDVKVHMFIGAYAVEVASEIIDKYVVDWKGLRHEFFMNCEMLMFTHKELELLSKVMECLESDGFSIAKMVSDVETLRTDGVESNYKKDIGYDLNEFKLIADGYVENIEVKSID